MKPPGPSVILVFGQKVRYLTIKPRHIMLAAVFTALVLALYILYSSGGEAPAATSTTATTVRAASTTLKASTTHAPTTTAAPSKGTTLTTVKAATTLAPTTLAPSTLAPATSVTVTTLEDYSWMPLETKTYLINSDKCQGWGENPCGNPDHKAEYAGKKLVCGYTDALPANARVSKVEITLSQLIGTTGESRIGFYLNDKIFGNITGNTNCDSDGPRRWMVKRSDYKLAGTNTITVVNLAPGGWATIGDDEGPSTVLFRVNVTYVNEALAAGVTTTTSTLPPGVVFQDGFNDGDDYGWRRYSEGWVVKEGAYTMAKVPDSRTQSVHAADWADYGVEAEVRMDAGMFAGVMARVVNDSNFYLCNLNLQSMQVELWVAKNDRFTQLAAVKRDIRLGETMKMRLDVRGSDMNCYLDDQLMAAAKDETYKMGGIGFYSWRGLARFDNVKVSSIKTTATTIPQTTTTLEASTTTAAAQASTTTMAEANAAASTTTATTSSTTTMVSGLRQYTRNGGFAASAEYWRFDLWDKNVGELVPLGRWMNSGGNTGGMVDVTIVRGKSNGVGGYWLQEFKTNAMAKTAECEMEWKVSDYTDIPKSLKVYMFVDGDDNEPQKGSEAWVSGEINGTTDWNTVKVDCTGKLREKGLHYFKIAVWSDSEGNFRGPYTVQFDNAMVRWVE